MNETTHAPPETNGEDADLLRSVERVREMIERTALWKHTERHGRLRGELASFLRRRNADIIGHWFRDEGIESFVELQKDLDIGLGGISKVDEDQAIAETFKGLTSFILHIVDPDNIEIYAFLRRNLRQGIVGRVSPTLLIIDILNLKDVTYRFLDLEYNEDPEQLQKLKDLFFYQVAELLCHIVEFVIELREETIRMSEESYREGINCANAGIVAFDPETGLIREANLLAGVYTGKKKEDLLGTPWWELFCPTQRSEVDSFALRILENGSAEESRMRICTPDGKLTPVMSSATVVNFKGEKLIQLIVVDITELVRLEEEAAYFRELAEGIVQSITSGVMVRDADKKIMYINDKYLEITGFDRNEVLGKTPPEIMGRLDIAIEGLSQGEAIVRMKEHVGLAEKGTAMPWQEAAIRHVKTGENRIVRVCHEPLRGCRGQPGRSLTIVEDITESRHLQMQLLQSEKMASIGQLAAGIAHEIRNPLAIISNALYDLDQICDKENQDIQEDISIAREEMSRVQDIINNLLEFSRESGSGSEAIDLASLIDKTLKLLGKDFQSRKVKIERSFEEKLKVFTNLNGLRQLLLNLITNAAHAMPDGGTLTVRTAQNDAGYVEIEVRDTGVGIAPNVLPNIFNPFFTTKPPGQGTGLGLSIVHSVVERMGGHIHVKSKPGAGTAFTVEIPRERDA